MVVNAESSKPSVNERLARAREQDLRRCRNIQAKLARAQQDPANPPTQQLIPDHASSSSSRRTGLIYLSATELAKRESDQRSRERQLKRQVAGPIPPQSWRDDFDRLSVRRGVAFDKQRLQDLVSTVDDVDDGSGESEDRQAIRRNHARMCSGLRFCLDEDDGNRLSLRDMTLCVIADALNRPSSHKVGKSKDQALIPEMDRPQLRQVLEYLPKHMQDRLLALCGRLAATDWPLGEWTAQALIALDRRPATVWSEDNDSKEADDDWEHSINTNTQPPNLSSDGTTLDLSHTAISARTVTRLISAPSYYAVSLTTLSLAGYPTSPDSRPLDSASMHSILASLPNLRVLSLANSSLCAMQDSQRAAVFLRKLSRSVAKLEMLDLSFCDWISAEAILAVSWATKATVAWPRMRRLVLFGCESVTDPRTKVGKEVGCEAAGSHVAPWHTTHTQRPISDTNLYDGLTDVTHRDPFDLFSAPPQRSSARAGFSDYVNGAIQPAIITHMSSHDAEHGMLMEYVRCPRSSGKIEMWQWTRARILDAVRGRTSPSTKQRRWIDVHF